MRRESAYQQLEDLGVVKRSWVQAGVARETWVGFIEPFERGGGV